MKKVYTDENTRIRLNLEQIIDLRNASTHFITQEYELKYVPLFQACVFNYQKELKRRHGIDILEKFPDNFLALTAHVKPLSTEELRVKYPAEIAEMLIRKGSQIDGLAQSFDSDAFSVSVRQNLYITKKKDEADFTVSVESGSENKVQIVSKIKDPNNTHPYCFTDVVKLTNEALLKTKIHIDNKKGFTSTVLTNFINFYRIKEDEKYCFVHQINRVPQYSYSRALIDFIVDEIKKNPNKFCASLKEGSKLK